MILHVLIQFLALFLSILAKAQQTPFLQMDSGPIVIGSQWEVLGPFQSGTREQQWGADPLEAFSGFHNISFDPSRSFTSTLNGSVHFSTLNASAIVNDKDFVSRRIGVTFLGIDWKSLQKTFGWASLQFQAWIRGTIIFREKGRYGIWIGNAVEFYVDGVYYDAGNLYDTDVLQFSRGGIFLDLEEGEHVLEIRVVNDIRAFGGQVPPKVDVQVAVRKVEDELVIAEYESHGGWNVPSAIEVTGHEGISKSCLAGDWGSFALRNEGPERVIITSLRVDGIESEADYIRLAPGQQRPIRFKLGKIIRPYLLAVEIKFKHDNVSAEQTKSFSHQLRVIHDLSTPHQFTHTHSDPKGLVSSAIIKPPKSLSSYQPYYILVALHGAGVENNSPFWAHDAYRDLDNQNIFVVQPSGVTSWGDDWHGAWSSRDAQSAIKGVQEWTKRVADCLPSADALQFWDRVIVAGHSNGGQGTWYALTHWSDTSLLAGNPISGYSSIPMYVPYSFWQPLEGKKALIRDIALRSYDHALLAENAVPFRIHVKHGSDDDNVPVWHSRRLAESVKAHGGSIKLDEVPGEGHWFDGVMTHGETKDFLRDVTSHAPSSQFQNVKFVISNPREMGRREDVTVEQLLTWQSPGRVEIEREINDDFDVILRIKSWNIRRMTIHNLPILHQIYINGVALPKQETESVSFLIHEDGNWKVETSDSPDWKADERHGRQLGPLAAIMDTVGPLTIVVGTGGRAAELPLDRIASTIAQNLFIYFGADVEILYDYEATATRLSGNVICLGMEDDNVFLADALRAYTVKNREFPIRAGSGGILVKDVDFQIKYKGNGVGAIYLHPLPREGLLLCICGTDLEGVERAARLFPYRTGAGQPDWIVVGPKMGIQGLQGVKAMGYYSNLWDIESDVSYLSYLDAT